jgi:adenine C2-methylase RlmN of 23S rRNA A2503 and tRNA A37
LENWWLTVTVRDSMWRKVKSACGQLWYQKINEQSKNK